MYEINAGSLADNVLQSGDIFISATIDSDTTYITRQYHIIDLMLDMRVDDVVTIKILRDGAEKEVSITITEDCLTAY